jgi:hypothetical protein
MPKFSPDDRLVGIRAHKKKDLINGCNEPGTKWFTHNIGEFQKTICRICRNPECIRAGNSETPWHARMEQQPEYLINNPVFSDLSLPKHQELAKQVFDDLTQKAMRLEVARIRQDWEIPEGPEGPTDGYERLAAKKANDDVADAIRELTKARGGEPEENTEPEAPEPEAPKHFIESETTPEPEPPAQEPPEVEYETQYPSSDGSTNYRIALTTDGKWSCECGGWKHTRKCKHLDRVSAWYEEHKNDNQLEAQPEPEPEPPPPPRAHPPPRPVQPTPQPASYNTPMPGQGVMVDGGDAPQRAPSQLPPEPHDPWAPRKDTLIQPGATVVVKSKKK